MRTVLTPATLATLERLENANWFSKVGIHDSTKALVLSSWAESIEIASSIEWENIGFEAANRFCEKLLRLDKPRFNEWNSVVDLVKPVVEELVERKARSIVLQESLPKSFIDSVQWDILHLFMETEYSDLIEPGFYAGTAYWYAVGHFPCGWDGQLPEGRPIIF